MKNQQSVVVKFLPELTLPLLMVVLGTYMFIVSFGYQFETRLFAQATAFILVFLSLAVIVRDTLRGVKKAQGGAEEASPSTLSQITPLLFALLWCVAFFVLVLLVGFVIAAPVWVLGFLLKQKASWLATVITPLVLWALIKLALEYGLDTILFQGILFGEHLPVFW